MQAFVYPALAGLVAVFVFAGPKPASALPATTALNHAQASAEIIQIRGGQYRPNRKYQRPQTRNLGDRQPSTRTYKGYRPIYGPRGLRTRTS